MISVYLGFDVPDNMLPTEGTGFISANSNDLSCNACTWTSRKWEHTSSNRNLLVRLFYKSSHPVFSSLDKMNKEELLQVARQDIHKSLGIAAKPIASEVTNWFYSMPNSQITHPKTVATLERNMETMYPGMMIADCSYYGVGIPDCIESGERTAYIECCSIFFAQIVGV